VPAVHHAPPGDFPGYYREFGHAGGCIQKNLTGGMMILPVKQVMEWWSTGLMSKYKTQSSNECQSSNAKGWLS
jgi:superfamily II DNA helicase RecQ